MRFSTTNNNIYPLTIFCILLLFINELNLFIELYIQEKVKKSHKRKNKTCTILWLHNRHKNNLWIWYYLIQEYNIIISKLRNYDDCENVLRFIKDNNNQLKLK